MRILGRGTRVQGSTIERDQARRIDPAVRLLRGGLELGPRVRDHRGDGAIGQVPIRGGDHGLQPVLVTEQVEQAGTRPGQLLVVLRRFPPDERIEGHAHRRMSLEADDLRLRTLADPLRQAGERGARAIEYPVIEHRDLELLDPETIREEAHEAAQALGRYEHERAELAALRPRALLERGHAVQRDEGLAHAGLAIEYERRIRGEVHGVLLLAVENDHGVAVAGRRAYRLGAGAEGLAGGADLAVLPDQRFELAAADGEPALEHAALGGPIAGLQLVGLPGGVPEEHRCDRRGPPVEHRDLGLEVGLRAEHEPALATLGVHGEVRLGGR